MNGEDKDYHVVFSVRVREHIFNLANESKARGDLREFTHSMKQFELMLRIYPQFGDPHIDLYMNGGIMYHCIFRPLFMKYIVFDELRTVYVTSLPVLLPYLP
jgi:hypothetical protein